ncbi:MAG: SDR family NAD(P)-dependent oxidoreductase [Acidobacteriota bacterium]
MDASTTPLSCDLSGHVALVTGANHGIGAATAIILARLGASVLLSYFRTADPPDYPATYRENRARTADEVLATIHRHGGRAISLEADLRDARTPVRLFDYAEGELGPIDILVNNASGWVADTFAAPGQHATGTTVEHISAFTHDAVFSVDARGGALTIAEFATRHIQRRATWGRIVGLTSGGPLGFPNEVSYGAAKAAMENYTMAAAFELARFGVTANVVYPPVTDTGWVTPAVREFVARSPELIHVVQAEEVAEVVAFLCSDRARLITANVLHLR